jgi:hypothetical protein
MEVSVKYGIGEGDYRWACRHVPALKKWDFAAATVACLPTDAKITTLLSIAAVKRTDNFGRKVSS